MSVFQASPDMLRLYGLSQVELTAARERIGELEKEVANLLMQARRAELKADEPAAAEAASTEGE